MDKKEILKEGVGALSALTSRIKKPKQGTSVDLSDIESPDQAFQRIYGETAKTPQPPPALKVETAKTENPTLPEVTENIATACIPCSLGHYSVSAGLLNEAVRFKNEGITSNEILDRIAKILEEMNALERVDLAPEKILNSPAWERDLAENALTESRKLRHSLEGMTSIKDLEEAAAHTSKYYKELNREWYKRRLGKLSSRQTEDVN